MISLLLWLSAALAFEEVCDAPYRNAQFRTDLQQVDQAFADLDVAEARARISGVHRRLLCLDERVDPHGMGRFARQLSLAFFFDQDEAAMTRWARASRFLAPELPWYSDMDESHPFRELFAEVELPAEAGPESGLVVSKSGAIFWNGLARTEPTAPIETPGLVQLADKKDSYVRLWWQDGSAFPEELLGPVGALTLPGWVEPVAADAGFAEDAARPLFGEAEIAVAEAVAVIDEAVDEGPGAYIDPFEDARRRAVRRETFESKTTNNAGDQVNIRTEVVTMARDDRSAGKPVTYEVFEYWMPDVPEWSRAAAIEAGRADSTYLSDWVDGRPPKGASRTALVWVPFDAAAAYCASFGNQLARAGRSSVDQTTWEWRLDGATPVRVSPKGKVKGVDDRKQGRDDTTFRCAVQ